MFIRLNDVKLCNYIWNIKILSNGSINTLSAHSLVHQEKSNEP